MHRRSFLKSAAMSALLPHKALHAVSTHANKHGYVIAMTDRAGQHQIARLSAQGDIMLTKAMPSRRHSFAINQTYQHILSVGRRPSTDIIVMDLAANKSVTITAASHRHFYGHAIFCPDDRFLYTTENNYEAGTGVIGIRDASNHYRLVQEFSSYGIGPHALTLTRDNQCLLVANGGVRTHPAMGRKKLNLDTMAPCLAIIDRRSGELKGRVSLSQQQRHNSVRHLANNDHDQIIIALQNQRSDTDDEVLLARYDYQQDHDQHGMLQPIIIPTAVRQQLGSYLGDIVYDQSQRYFAASAPRGNRVLIYQVPDRFVAAIQVTDACGLHATHRAAEFLVTSGTGQIIHIAADNQWQPQALAFHHQFRWDNHLLSVG